MAVDWDYYGSVEALEDRMAELTVEIATTDDDAYARRWLNAWWKVYEARLGRQ